MRMMYTRTGFELALLLSNLLPILVSKKDAAEVLGVCVRTLEYLAAAKRIVTRRVGGRTLVLYSSLQNFARRDTLVIEKPTRKTPRAEKPTSVAVADGR
jgi:hypothetical protein